MTETQEKDPIPILQPKGFPKIPADWKVTTDYDDGIFSYHFTKPQAENNRTLLIVHGMGEYGLRYAHFAHYLKKSVDRIVAMDLRGHGRSEGLRGHIQSTDEYVEDIVHQIKKLTKEKTELHFFSHSMGSLMAIQTLLKNPNLPLRSVTLSAPFLEFKMHVPLPKRLMGQLLSHVWGTIQFSSDVVLKELSRDPAVWDHYAQDRLIHKKATPKWFVNIKALQEHLRSTSAQWNYSTQFLVPLSDGIVDCQASIAFYERLKAKEKRLIQYPDTKHESFNDINKDQVLLDIEEWILKHA